MHLFHATVLRLLFLRLDLLYDLLDQLHVYQQGKGAIHLPKGKWG
jgi:hypothetical protein